MADEFYISLFETSAKESINTDDLFIKMAKDIQKRNQSKTNNFFDKFSGKNKLYIDWRQKTTLFNLKQLWVILIIIIYQRDASQTDR